MSDSTQETIAHIHRVQELLREVCINLQRRAQIHDASKLEEPEKSAFDEATNVLKGLTYGSPEYKAQLEKLKPALEHHYAHNSHHPEHYAHLECNICFGLYPKDYKGSCTACGNGSFTSRPQIAGMSLLDLVEMFCDWKAATERHADDDIDKSIRINAERFDINPQITSIFQNTVTEMKWQKGGAK